MRGSILLLAVLLAGVLRQAGAQALESKIIVDASELKTRINRNIYGHFSEHLGHCIYGGYWVGERSSIPNTNGIRNDVVAALKQIRIPVLRWPGGCFADEYHWMDGIGPREKRPSMINTHWGGVTEDNSFGTHEFLELCRQLECEPYFCGNVGSGSVQEFSQWVEYVNSDNVSPMTELRKKNGRDKSWGVKFWGIGNEPWGCGGNMRPEYYADLMRRYGTYSRNYGNNKLFKVASGKYSDDYNWTEVLMREGGKQFDGLSYHYYAFGDGKPATEFDEHGWFNILNTTLKIDEYLTKHCAVMDKYDPEKRVALIVDEWGTWHGVEPGTNPGFLYQQNTIRDAVAAACNLNIFNNHCDRVRMANIAQTINVLQAMILTDGEKMTLTPTYHVFDLFKVHQDALWLKTQVQAPDYVMGKEKIQAVNCSASVDSTGKVHVSLVNLDPKNAQKISCAFVKFTPARATGMIITASIMNAHNTFEKPHVVEPKSFSDVKVKGEGLEASLPPMSVVVLEVEGKMQATEGK
jgi:alpha-L-arabinofuranosidase